MLINFIWNISSPFLCESLIAITMKVQFICNVLVQMNQNEQ
ncbi:hypothetical protein L911_3018 [Vibrio fluvialis I21563]|nr:hypothetical protein L911_3018 [Vibrio fluvialis I21563]